MDAFHVRQIVAQWRKLASFLFVPSARSSVGRRVLLGAALGVFAPNPRVIQRIPASGRVVQPAEKAKPAIDPNDKLAAIAAFLPKDKDGQIDPNNRADLEKFLKGKDWKAFESLVPSIASAFGHNLGEQIGHSYGNEAHRLAYVVQHARQAMGGAIADAAQSDKRNLQALQRTMMQFFVKVHAAYDYHETDQRRTAAHHTVADVLKDVLAKAIPANSNPAAQSKDVVVRHLNAHVEVVQQLVNTYPAFTRATAKVILKTCADSDVSVPVCLSTAAAESFLDPTRSNKTTGATGMAQYQEPDWYRAINWLDKTESGRIVLGKYQELRELKDSLQMVDRDQHGQGNFIVVDKNVLKGDPKKTAADKAKTQWAKDLRLNPEISLAVWACQTETSIAVMSEILKRKPSAAEMWLSNIIGPSRAARFSVYAAKSPQASARDSGILTVAEIEKNPLFDRNAKDVMVRAEGEVALAKKAAPVLAVHVDHVPVEARPDPSVATRPAAGRKQAQVAAPARS